MTEMQSEYMLGLNRILYLKKNLGRLLILPKGAKKKRLGTLDSGINVGVRLLIFEKFRRQKKIKNDRNA